MIMMCDNTCDMMIDILALTTVHANAEREKYNLLRVSITLNRPMSAIP
jgi:hypothetical protein